MSPIRFVGLVITLLGYVAGAILVAQPFLPELSASSLALALLFPACLGLGLPLYAAGAERGSALRLSGWGLLLLGLLALVGVFVDAIGVYAASTTLILWLVAPLAISGGLLLTYFAGALDRLKAEGLAQD